MRMIGSRKGKDLSGEKFGVLDIVRYVGSDGHSSLYECKCEQCGTVRNYALTSLYAARKSGRKFCRGEGCRKRFYDNSNNIG